MRHDVGAAGLTPAVVVVDSRNMWGAARRQFGVGQRVVVAGVRSAMQRYGFDAIQVFVGIATESTAKHPSVRLREALEVNAKYAEAITADPSGHVLHGRLAGRNGDIEEKLVDVLCAMQIARSAHEIAADASPARAIVVLSEDMDLIPAYRFAQDLDVPVFAAAAATVDTRQDSSWLLLGEGPLRALCERPKGRSIGQELRDEISKWLTAPQPYCMQFRVAAYEAGPQQLRLFHSSGAVGLWHQPPPGTELRRGSSHQLHVVGVERCSSERDFPLLTLEPSPVVVSNSALVWGTVDRWTAPTRVLVTLDSGLTKGLGASVGSVLPGDRVLVHEDRDNPQGAWRLVGRLGGANPTPGWPGLGMPQLARVIAPGTTAGARVGAVLVESGERVTLQPPGGDIPNAGDVYAVVPISHQMRPDGSLHVTTVSVSSVVQRAG